MVSHLVPWYSYDNLCKAPIIMLHSWHVFSYLNNVIVGQTYLPILKSGMKISTKVFLPVWILAWHDMLTVRKIWRQFSIWPDKLTVCILEGYCWWERPHLGTVTTQAWSDPSSAKLIRTLHWPYNCDSPTTTLVISAWEKGLPSQWCDGVSRDPTVLTASLVLPRPDLHTSLTLSASQPLYSCTVYSYSSYSTTYRLHAVTSVQFHSYIFHISSVQCTTCTPHPIILVQQHSSLTFPQFLDCLHVLSSQLF